MTTVVKGRARATPAQPVVSDQGDGLFGWVQKKAINDLRKQTFAYELQQGLLTIDDLTGYNDLKQPVIEELVKHYLSLIELNKMEESGDKFQVELDKAVRDNNYDFDFSSWDSDFTTNLKDHQDYEIVFFKNRTTAFTLPKPCPNCGQKKLVAEGQVFTRAADEAASQFATCKNCSSRFRLQSVI